MSSSAQATITKYHRVCCLNSTNLFSHRLGGWQVQDQGAGQFGA